MFDLCESQPCIIDTNSDGDWLSLKKVDFDGRRPRQTKVYSLESPKHEITSSKEPTPDWNANKLTYLEDRQTINLLEEVQETYSKDNQDDRPSEVKS